MRLSILTLATIATATSATFVERDPITLYPLIQVLPVPGYNTASDGFNGLAAIYTNGAGLGSAQANAIAQTNTALSGSGGVQYTYDVKANLTTQLSTVGNLFWQTAYDAEKKVCAIVTSINQQNVDNVKGNLRAGIFAEAQAIVKIANTLIATVNAIKAQAGLFVDSEKAVVAALIQAIAAAASASIEPVATLSAGLTATGVTGINDVVSNVQGAVASLQAASQIRWDVS